MIVNEDNCKDCNGNLNAGGIASITFKILDPQPEADKNKAFWKAMAENAQHGCLIDIRNGMCLRHEQPFNKCYLDKSK